MIPKHYAQRCVQPLRLVDQKVILYPEKRETPRHFLIIDPNPPISLTSVTVPYYPEANEVIQTSNNTFLSQLSNPIHSLATCWKRLVQPTHDTNLSWARHLYLLPWPSEPFPITKAAVVSFCHSRFPKTTTASTVYCKHSHTHNR